MAAVVCVALLSLLGPGLAVRVPPSYDIHLETPSQHRWGPIVRDLVEKHGFEHSFGRFLRMFESFADTVLYHSPSVFALMQDTTNKWKTLHPDWAAEQDGLRSAFLEFGYNLSTNTAAVMPFSYEMTILSYSDTPLATEMLKYRPRGCTSIVAASEDGGCLHGRNLDAFPEQLANITAVVHWKKQNITVYSTVHFVSCPGFYTLVRLGAYSLAQNTRFFHDQRQGLPLAVFVQALNTTQTGPSGWVLRDAVESFVSYTEIVAHLSSTPFPAPQYLSLGGAAPWQGTVLARNFTDVVHAAPALSETSWFLVQTNDDAWRPPLDGRREQAEGNLDKLGQGEATTPQGMLQVLSTPSGDHGGVLNEDTVFSAVLSPVDGVRLVVEPCFHMPASPNPCLARGSGGPPK